MTAPVGRQRDYLGVRGTRPMDFVCPRCSATVIEDDGRDPHCGACNYPGADSRPEADRHVLAGGDDRVLSGKAVASMVLGITSAIPGLGLASAITAIPLGVRALRDIEESHGELKGAAQARAGVITGIAGIALQAAFLSGVAAAAWQRFRD